MQTEYKTYQEFLASKRIEDVVCGFKVDPATLNKNLFPFQRAIVAWALQRGRAGIFASTGLGKALMALEWANQVYLETGKNVIIVTPLAVAEQTKREGEKFGIKSRVIKCTADLYNTGNEEDEESSVEGDEPKTFTGINICHYEVLKNIDCREFVGVALDEASILKNYTGSVRSMIIDTFSRTPYRLSLSATPAPNDYMELGNQSQFLGILSYHEMLSMFFIHDSGETQKWRLKGHAREEFWKWMCSWAVNIRKPSDLGFSDDGYNLPELFVHHEIIPTELEKKDRLSLQDASKLRRETIDLKVERCRQIVESDPENYWLIWCGLNDESKKLTNSNLGAVELKGSETMAKKEEKLLAFTDGKIKKLVTKPEIAGFGLNWQHCNRQVFCGVDFSFEAEYQAIRRSWRFGQDKEVYVHIVLTDAEAAILENIKNKEDAFHEMFRNMALHMKEESQKEIVKASKMEDGYAPNKNMVVPMFLEAA